MNKLQSILKRQQIRGQEQFFGHLKSKPFWIWDKEPHKIQQIMPNGYSNGLIVHYLQLSEGSQISSKFGILHYSAIILFHLVLAIDGRLLVSPSDIGN